MLDPRETGETQDPMTSSTGPESIPLILPINANIENQGLIFVRSRLVSSLQIMGTLVKLCVPMALSYSFSAMLVAIGMIIGRIGHLGYSRHFSQHDESLDLAAIPLITITLQTISTVGVVAPLFPMSITAAGPVGELRALLNQREELSKQENPDYPQIEAANQSITRLHKSIRDVFRSGVTMGVVPCGLAMAALIKSEEILTLLGMGDDVAKMAAEFLSPYGYIMPAFILRMLSEQMLFAHGKTNIAMVISLVNFTIGTLTSLYLTFGPPNLGISGVAYGYMLEAVLTAFGYAGYIGLNREFRPLRLFACDDILTEKFLSTLRGVFTTGLGFTLQLGFDLGLWQLFVTFCGWLGAEALSAYAFTSFLQFLTIIPAIAFSQGVSQETGRNMGENNFPLASLTARIGLLISVLLTAGITLPLALQPEWLTTLITQHAVSEGVFQEVKRVVPWMILTTGAEAMRQSEIQTLRLAKQNLGPTLLSILVLSAGAVLAYLLAFPLEYGVSGVIAGQAIGTAGAAAALFPGWWKNTAPEVFQAVSTREESEPSGEMTLFERTRNCVSGCCPNFFARNEAERLPSQEHETAYLLAP